MAEMDIRYQRSDIRRKEGRKGRGRRAGGTKRRVEEFKSSGVQEFKTARGRNPSKVPSMTNGW
jgi:hypothetical protein